MNCPYPKFYNALNSTRTKPSIESRIEIMLFLAVARTTQSLEVANIVAPT
jgi:hypothetical protein